MSAARQKAKELIALALDEGGEEKERVSAALKAVKIIAKYDLLSSPLDGLLSSDNETVSAAADVFQRLTDPSFIKSVKKIGSKVARPRARQRTYR